MHFEHSKFIIIIFAVGISLLDIRRPPVAPIGSGLHSPTGGFKQVIHEYSRWTSFVSLPTKPTANIFFKIKLLTSISQKKPETAVLCQLSD